jgi:hypothetical protein
MTASLATERPQVHDTVRPGASAPGDRLTSEIAAMNDYDLIVLGTGAAGLRARGAGENGRRAHVARGSLTL